MGKRKLVGVFDSGIGGLNVLFACERLAPDFDYCYFGDNARAPYGSRPPEVVTAFVREALTEFSRLGADAAVLACNTATAVCAEEMRRAFPFPIVGMEPAVKPAAEVSKNVLILSTPLTAQSDRLKSLLARFPACRFTVCAAPRLAGAIERALPAKKKIDLSEHLPKGEFDGVVLGCTHYSFLKNEISHHYGNIPTFDGSEGTARHLKRLLEGRAVDAEWSENTKTNKSSPAEWSENGADRVVFLGKCAEINQKIYKQTFKKDKNASNLV